MQKAAVFDETYRHYLERIASLDLASLGPKLGIGIEGNAAVVPLFGRPYTVRAQGVADQHGRKPDLGISIILFKYLLMCPQTEPGDHSLCTFKDFKDAGPLVDYFKNNAKLRIENHFRGRVEALDNACRKVGGVPVHNDLSYQIKYRFQGLPKIPVYLFFNDQEDGFPAQCTFLFPAQRRSLPGHGEPVHPGGGAGGTNCLSYRRYNGFPI